MEPRRRDRGLLFVPLGAAGIAAIGLRWVDMLAGDVLSLTAGGAVGRRNVGAVAAAVRPRCGGGR